MKWTLDTIAGADSLRASLSSGATALGTVNATHISPANAFKVSGDSQVVAIGSAAAPLVVRVTDRYGNPVAGFQVAWAATTGLTPIGLTSKTDSNGLAQASVGTADESAEIKVIATTGFAPALVFTVIAR